MERILTNEKFFFVFFWKTTSDFRPAMRMQATNTCSQLRTNFHRERNLSNTNWTSHYILDFSQEKMGILCVILSNNHGIFTTKKWVSNDQTEMLDFNEQTLPNGGLDLQEASSGKLT